MTARRAPQDQSQETVPGIGYACLARGIPETAMRTCRLQNATPERLAQLTGLNLQALRRLIAYNIQNGIRLFRISSDLIPLASHPVNTVPWWDIFRGELAEIGALASAAGMRLSMHPGQYTVLNALDPAVVKNAIADLAYHTRVLEALGTGPSSKIILHLGGVYGDRKKALQRFRTNVAGLDDRMRCRIAIENDERHFGIADVLETGLAAGLPVVFDNLHHAVFTDGPAGIEPAQTPAAGQMDLMAGRTDRPTVDGAMSVPQWIASCRETWRPADGRQKIHYAQQAADRKPGAHSATIRVRPFLEFCAGLTDRDIDIMLEVKDKNLSAVKCSLSLAADRPILALEQEWSRYKYNVLEKSPQDYQAIRQLLKDKAAWPAAAFYEHLEHAWDEPPDAGRALNAAQHVWGYFKDRCSEGERLTFARLAAGLGSGTVTRVQLKAWLHRLAAKYQESYLLASYYFLDLP